MTATAMRYRAFISYSHRDKAVAAWVQGALERYQIPSKLVGRETALGPVPARLHPLFRDRDELPASGDLGSELMAALQQSMFLILICSPASARSRWVNEEVLSFKRMHGEGRVLALICQGEPGDPELECFPRALQFTIGADGKLTDTRAEPVAADIRPKADGKRLAKFKLIAGLTGLRLDDLIQREAARRARRLTLIATAASIGMVGSLALAFYANDQRQVAERQRQLAEKSVEFLTSTFAIANPATDNPRTITVLSILDRASKRAADELSNEPEVAARLLQTTGRIYLNLGLPKESERDLHTALALSPPTGEMRAHVLLALANGAYGRSDAKATLAFVNAAEAAIGPDIDEGSALTAEISYWRAMVQYLEGNYARSAAELRQTLALYGALPGDHREEQGRVWMSEGRALTNSRDTAAADAAFAMAESLYTSKFGTNHLLTAVALSARALGALGNKRYDIAELKISQALGIYNRILDANHPRIASSTLLLGRILTARGDYERAITAFDRSRKIYSDLYGRDNTNIGDVNFYAAEAESGRGDTEAALRLLAKTKQIYDTAYGPDDPDQVELRMARVKVYGSAGRIAEAAADCEAAVLLAQKLDPNDRALTTMQSQCDRLSAGVYIPVADR